MIPKRGQITIFLLVGIVLLVAFGFLFYLYSAFSSSSFSEAQQEEISLANVRSGELEQIFSSCLQTAANSVLYDAGLQAGLLYESQNGPHKIPTKHILHVFDTSEVQVPFGVSQIGTTGAALDVEPPLPYYPLQPTAPQGIAYTLAEIESEFGATAALWGRNTLPKLCQQGGPNSRSQDRRGASCLSGTVGISDSIQRGIHNATLERTRACITAQTEHIKELSRDVIFGVTKLDVVYTDSSVLFTLNIEGDVFFENFAIRLSEVTYNAPARLLRMYNLAYRVIEHEIRSVLFDMRRDYVEVIGCQYTNNTYCYDSQMSIALIEDVSGVYKGSQIYMITDEGSTINGRPYRFAFAVENRRPMLEYYDEYELNSTISQQVDQTAQIRILPQAYNPDPGKVIIEYEGFKQNAWSASALYNDGSLCTQAILARVGASTSDALALGEDYWCGNISITDYRPGVYNLRLTARDEGGLHDYQELRISVGAPADQLPFCPARRYSGLTQSQIGSMAGTIADCASGSFCNAVSASPPTLRCEGGSACCQATVAEQKTLECQSGATCYQTDVRGDATTLNCKSGATCYQEVRGGDATLNCEAGSNCYQEVRLGTGTITCNEGANCRQENDAGTITMECNNANRDSVHPTQNGTHYSCYANSGYLFFPTIP